MLQALLDGSEAWLASTPVVLQARLVPGVGPVDFWLYGTRVVVEVDGLQHRGLDYMSTRTEQQTARDKAKEGAAMHAGYHVVRLDEDEPVSACTPCRRHYAVAR